MMNRHLTTMERLAATIAIIFAVAQFLLIVNASSSTTLPIALSRQQLLSSHHTNNRNVCDSKVTQSNATIEEEDIDKKSAASLLAVRAFHKALNNLLIVRSALSTMNSSTTSSPQLFKIGTIVELYRDESYFATPAIITSTSNGDGSDNSVITMQNTITSSTYSTIETSYIHTYTQYTDGTRASCNVSPPNSNEVYMTPCVVNTSYVREHSGLILYEVSYLNVDDDSLVRETLPFSRVQRRRQPLISEL